MRLSLMRQKARLTMVRDRREETARAVRALLESRAGEHPLSVTVLRAVVQVNMEVRAMRADSGSDRESSLI